MGSRVVINIMVSGPWFLVFNVPVRSNDLEALFLGGRSPRNYRCRYGLEEVGDNIGWAVEFGI